MNAVHYLEVGAEEEGQRLDNYLIRILKGVPKSHIYRIVRGGEVRVNKKRAAINLRLVAGDRVRIPPIRISTEKNVPVAHHMLNALEKSIIFEDDHLLVINKPAGIAVHGGSGLSLGVIEALRRMRTELPYLELAHRLDRETSGCLLLAKKRSMLRAIHALLESRQITKTYWALLADPWQGKKIQHVDIGLEKNILKSGERIVVVNNEGKASQTQFKLLENYSLACWVEAQPKTGRTHQIRVHSAYLQHPIIGDDKYGKHIDLDKSLFTKHRLYLHARSIQFNLNGKEYCFTAELDGGFSQTLQRLKTTNT